MDPQTIPADVLALLQELDTDPDAAIGKLAVLPPKPRARKLQSSDQRIAEELGTVYREETSRLLARYAQTTQFEDPYWEGLLHRSVRKGVELELTPFESIRKRALVVQNGLGQVDREAHREREYLAELGRPCPTVGALNAALVSWRMRANDHAALIAAWEYIRLGEYEGACGMLSFVAGLPTSSLHGSIAWEVRGALALRIGNLEEAALAFNEASDWERDRPAPLLSWLVVACTIGAAVEADEAARRVDDMIDETDSSLQSCLNAYEALSARGLFEGRLSDRLNRDRIGRGPASGRILNALS